MHRALTIDDILRVIFVKDKPDYKPEFYNLAMTCKTFLEPALDGLWYSLTDISHLLLVFPEDAIRHPNPDEGWAEIDNVVDLDRPLLPGEWDRFDYYAKRIYNLRQDHYKYQSRLVRNVQASHRVTPFLPNLRFIHMAIFGLHFDVVALFLAPNTKELSLGMWYGDDDNHPQGLEQQSLVKNIIKSGAAFESLKIPTLSKYNALSLFATQMAQSLQVIALSELIDWPAIECLATLPLLHNVRISDDCVPPSKLPAGSAPPSNPTIINHASWFPSLRQLHGHTDYVLPILSSFQSCNTIVELSVVTNSFADVQKVINLTGSTFQSIHRLTFRWWWQDTIVLSPPIIFIHPLRNCSNLKDFILNNTVGFQSPSDDVYLSLSQAWPKLENISIGRTVSPHATLSAVAAFSRNCPELESIGFDTEEVDTVPENLQFGRLRKLRQLRLGVEARFTKINHFPKGLWEKLGSEMAQPGT